MSGYCRCPEKTACFAKRSGGVLCSVLKAPAMHDGHCVFQKEVRDITNGKRYPMSQMYAGLLTGFDDLDEQEVSSK